MSRGKSIILPVLLTVGFLASLTSCVSQEQYRPLTTLCRITEGDECQQSQFLVMGHELESELRPSADVYLGVLEFDDQGEPWDREQARNLLNEVERLADQEPISIVVYAHGWNHNASAADSDTMQFLQLLVELSKAEAAFSEADGNLANRTVVGIYLGWRGKSLRYPMHYLTFWTRKGAAHRIGTDGAFEILNRLSQIRNNSSYSRRHRLALIGHSFGGALMFSATSHALSASLESMSTGEAQRFADIVVIANAAFEAERLNNLLSRSYELEGALRDQMPIFLSITSMGDSATGKLFPLGRFFSTMFQSHRTREEQIYHPIAGFDQRTANRTAIGHYEPFVTHILTPRRCSVGEATVALQQCAEASSDELLPAEYISEFEGTAQSWHSAIRHMPKWRIEFPTATLYHASGPPAGPVMNVRTNDSLVDGHNGIWAEPLMLFIRDFVAMNYAAAGLAREGQEGGD